MRLELVPEDFGGDTITAAISAKTGDGVDNLLEMISLVAELEDLRAPVDGTAEGVIIESVLDKRAGVLATVLVQKGTLRVADYLVSGEVWAKIRRMTDEAGKQIVTAGPSVPVQILGFSEQPVAGDRIVAVPDEASAKALVAERRTTRQDDAVAEADGKKALTIADLRSIAKRRTPRQRFGRPPQPSLAHTTRCVAEATSAAPTTACTIIHARACSSRKITRGSIGGSGAERAASESIYELLVVDVL